MRSRKALNQRDLIQNIFRLLKLVDIFALARVSKSWRDAAFHMPLDSFKLDLYFEDDDIEFHYREIDDLSFSFLAMPVTTRLYLCKFVSHVEYWSSNDFNIDVSQYFLQNVSYMLAYDTSDSIRRHMELHSHRFKIVEFSHGTTFQDVCGTTSFTFPNAQIITLYENLFQNFPLAKALVLPTSNFYIDGWQLHPQWMNLPNKIKILVLELDSAQSMNYESQREANMLHLNWSEDFIQLLIMPFPHASQIEEFKEKFERCSSLQKVIFIGDAQIPEDFLPPHIAIEKRDAFDPRDGDLIPLL